MQIYINNINRVILENDVSNIALSNPSTNITLEAYVYLCPPCIPHDVKIINIPKKTAEPKKISKYFT